MRQTGLLSYTVLMTRHRWADTPPITTDGINGHVHVNKTEGIGCCLTWRWMGSAKFTCLRHATYEWILLPDFNPNMWKELISCSLAQKTPPTLWQHPGYGTDDCLHHNDLSGVKLNGGKPQFQVHYTVRNLPQQNAPNIVGKLTSTLDWLKLNQPCLVW